MHLCVIGSGYVGLVTGACLADSGNHVICVDNDAQKVERLSNGISPIYEPGLDELLHRNLAAKRLVFTGDLASAVAASTIVFIAVGTPPKEDGSADLAAAEAVARAIGKALKKDGTIIVTKSTVPVGTGARLEKIIAAETKLRFHVVSNPEFLKEGSAVEDFLKPDRVIVGTDSNEAAVLLSELYQPFVRNNKPILVMSRQASEMSKYAANAYLATRISFINEVAELCEQLNVNVDEVRRGMGTDARIGQHFLYPGIGYGGSCFPKDVQALHSMGKAAGVPVRILDAVHDRNDRMRKRMFDAIRSRFDGKLAGQRMAVWGLAFKPKTDDIREAPAMWIVEQLLAAGATVAVHDPAAMERAREDFGKRVDFCDDPYDALNGADALLVCTEWMEYRSPDFDLIRQKLRHPVIFDGRNIFDIPTMKRYDFEYFSVGRPPLKR